MAFSSSLLPAPPFAARTAAQSPPPRRLHRGRSICNASLEEPSSLSFALVSGGVIAALAATLSLADPERRRQRQAAGVAGGDEKLVVKDYFNTAGFERWKRIYGEAEDVNSVQLDIRQGHAQTVEKTLSLLARDGSIQGLSFCDAGCGTGSLAIPLALRGATVFASDISSSMVAEAERRAREALKSDPALQLPKFSAQDLESLSGKYHTVACLDVLIHYPQDKADGMIRHLASLAESRLIISFAPKTWYYSLLKRIGELFPGPSKATRAYLHAEEDVEAALRAAGWIVRNRDMTATRFYFSRLLEAVPVGSA
ncbi:hypothetical protein SELMODRAFT_93906 [Selaginella moellendorffii]|uniref:Magnesium-protoporphyrin IX methyltransferase C-terminal domain-containing protein n=1 Tax=Selaginella moellendorffii TaxID=88036 RepID=D8RGY8_SELML|nr:magnesium protoporphyrin IX methyltransferase, chloroplastic [Selaginella moellendorffii]EFJ28445.1 hypothetical protein SELMODRAFT_93906 [Selaginella moellendorffii]|eukprot:XP_002970315.1 magnesium protoporphyrin IX methyltransferase, chloroplastic [Selaginella moellendorffii]